MLKANTNGVIENFLQDEEKIKKILQTHSTPLNVIFPENFKHNIAAFKTYYEKYDLRGDIFYAHKSNKSIELLETCKGENIGIDTASLGELDNALTKNIKKIEATGPKDKDFLKKCIIHNIIINIDSFCELEQIYNLIETLKIDFKVKVFIRVSGFKSSSVSRFGIDIALKEKIINNIIKLKDKIDFLGCSFHIDTISSEEKSKAIIEVLQFYKSCINKGIYFRNLNIGGGFGISYLKNYDQWKEYLELLKYENIYNNDSITWGDNPFQFKKNANSVIGSGNIYTPYKKITGVDNLHEILSYKSSIIDNISIIQYLNENFIKLHIEPGRALHNHTGLTIAKVISIKKINKEYLIILDMNSFQLGSREQELFSNPRIIHKSKKVTTKQGVYFAGNLCLESDMIYKHKSFLGVIPQVDDLVIFINTGGYLMDFYENTAISQEIAKKIIILDE